ncbi:MAG: tetratricopeptide repeat protein [Burkholderiaceae bacterium]|nr:tetratricopeptide repeat protein [Burkholderiaceae bacterium]
MAPQSLPIDDVLQQAIAHHKAGRFQEAERLYRAILQVQSGHPDASHNLGVIAAQVGRHTAGLPLLKAAFLSNPLHERYALSYAEALLATGRHTDALNILADAVKRGLESDAVRVLQKKIKAALLTTSGRAKEAPPAEMQRLVILFSAGRFAEMEDAARILVERHPHSGVAWKALGTALLKQRKDAIYALQRAATLLPKDAETLSNLGNALLAHGQSKDAVNSYRRALKIKPDFVDAHYNLGNALQKDGLLADAVLSYRRTIALNSNYADAHTNLGNALLALGHAKDAVPSYRRTIELRPAFPEGYYNLGNALQEIGRLDEAIASYQKAIELDPEYSEAHNNLGKALRDYGQLDGAVASLRRVIQLKPNYAKAHSNLQIANFISGMTAMEMLPEAKRFGDLVAQRAQPHTHWANTPQTDRLLRIGLVSGDFFANQISHFLESVLVSLTKIGAGRHEFIAYYNRSRSDAVTERLKACCCDWHFVGEMSDENLAQLIRDDRIDILIDLSGHTLHNRLPMFAWKPAPVQAGWLGYFPTTGLDAIDYRITDPWIPSQADEVYFTEKIYRLPETTLCFTPPDMDLQVNRLPASVNGQLTFGCLNELIKMTDAVVALRAKVLHAVPESRLLLKAKQIDMPDVRQRTIERFASHGIESNRLILEGQTSRVEHLATYQRIDIALDPFPIPGGTITVEALWMGVPVLTLVNNHFMTHVGESVMQNAGLPDWIATNFDDYVARAVMHASDLQGLAALRDSLRQRVLASPLFDAPRFAAHFAAALRDMWAQWCSKRTEKV